MGDLVADKEDREGTNMGEILMEDGEETIIEMGAIIIEITDLEET